MAERRASIHLLTRCFSLAIFFLFFFNSVKSTEFSKQMVSEWANVVGIQTYHFTKNVTYGLDLQNRYETLNVSTIQVEWRPLLTWSKTNMEEYFHKKIDALKTIVEKAEDAYCKHKYNRDLLSVEVDYPNSKKLQPYLNDSGVSLEQSQLFKKEVTYNRSVIHIPTDVYDGSVEILNGLKWSEALNEAFTENQKNDPTLAWQYFGHDNGFMRVYPGSAWNQPNGQVDLYDARKRIWYIQGATSPKDVIIMVDASGSMRGVPMRIAKLSAMALIDTFEDNDFFNVISFNITRRVLLCNKTGKLVQATKKNKEMAKLLVEGILDGNMAIWREGVKEAFRLLKEARKNRQGSDCQQALMIFSDGTTNTLEDLYNELNPDKRVRVFTFPVGPPAESTTAMLKMARQNRGFFSRIQSIGAVRVVSESYIRVLSRPMAMAPKKNTSESVIWTSVYLDAIGLGMVVTGTLPVFYRPTVNKNCSTALKQSTDHLIGVVGTDVPLDKLNEFFLRPLVGPNAYMFGINNNGLVAFHPRLKTVYGYLANAPGVDLMDVEIPLTSSNLKQLRDAMINQTFTNTNKGPSQATLEVYDVSTDELRVSKRTFNIYHESLHKTPFSFAIATSDFGFKYSHHNVSGLMSKIEELLKASDINLEKWPYCPGTVKSDDPVQVLKAMNSSKMSSTCNSDMLTGLAVDLDATSGMNALWAANQAKYNSDNIKNIFVRTNYGVMRTYSPSGATPYVPNTVEYGRAVAENVRDQIISYYSPYYSGKKNRNSTTVRAYEKLVYSSKPVAVAGYDMDSDSFADMAFEGTKTCASGNCADVNCDRQGKSTHEGLYCYLLDENAFIVASNDKKSSGMFFGKVDNAVMELLVDHYGNETTAVFKKVVFRDYQAVTETKKGTGSSGSSLLSPLFELSSLVDWWRSKAVMFFMYFNVYNWLYSETKPFADANEDVPKNLSCVKDLTTYYTEKTTVLANGTSQCKSSSCSRSYIVASVPHSNLHLVVVDAKCGQCQDKYVSLGIPGEAPALDITNDESPCQSPLYRKRPGRCFETTNPESGYLAGRGSLHSPSIYLFGCIFLMAILLMRDST